MTTQAQVKWSIEADYFQGCSCDYGCPCEFEAPPSRGFCEGVGAWRINRGNYGNVSLNGLGLGFIVRFPAAMHLGNGTLGVFIDQRANAQQREALLQIASGKAGGLPFEIFPMLVTNFLNPQYVAFQFNVSGKNSSARMGNAASIAFEPIKNPVTGAEESIRVEHGTGFIFKDAEVVSAKECRASSGGLNFSWRDKAGFVTRIQYGN
jgi:hypothetical protein